MINRVQLLRNIGQFDSVDSGGAIPLLQITLIYAENGRGKTTLAAIMRSLATGDPLPINERRRLGVQHLPEAVLECDGGPPPAVFKDGVWSRTYSNLVVFDDEFIDQNIYSGLAVGAEHGQNLHDFILGAKGVILNRKLQDLVAQNEVHNTKVREKAAAISVAFRGEYSVDEFCALSSRPDIGDAVLATERKLAAASEQEPIKFTPPFEILQLPEFDLAAISHLLDEDLPSLDAKAAAQVQTHLESLGSGGESWIAAGLQRLSDQDSAKVDGTCPFCAQDLVGSPVITHYQAFFSAAYTDLKKRSSETLAQLTRAHGGEIVAAFERSVRIAIERRQFWSQFCDVPEIAIDTATVVRDWRAAIESVVATLERKQAAPLERIAVEDNTGELVKIYEAHRAMIAMLNRQFDDANKAIEVVKEQSSKGDSTALKSDLAKLKTTETRFLPNIASLCEDYISARDAKLVTDKLRNQAKIDLEMERTGIFPGFQDATNNYLQKFNAGFRLERVTPANTRGGPTCTYDVIILNTPVHIGGGVPILGEPSFRNTLSAGDRNTLALAFFFASLDKDPELADKVVVIDDPISSLDEHRALTTIQEIRSLATRVGQVIVLSHNKTFLCQLWESDDSNSLASLEVARDGSGSTLRIWDVNQDRVTENDRNHALLCAFVAGGGTNNREVARAIRPKLEAFCRVAYPSHFPPGTLLGRFRSECQMRIGTENEILSERDTQELDHLVEYANRYHHSTNPAWDTASINEGELRGFVERALRFTTRGLN